MAVLVLLWTSILLYLSLTPTLPHVGGLLGWDKFQHAAALGVLAFLICCTCLSYRKNLKISCFTGFVCAALFGGLIELLQGSLTVNRHADILDFVADSVGAFIMMLVVYLRMMMHRGKH
jgi:VanZ family protein